MIYRGRVWKFGDSISTDLMMPGFAWSAKTLEERASFCMRSIRPDWAQQVRKGDIIIAGRNFGCGSSRPATENLQALGIACVVAESVSRIFFRQSVNLGFLPLTCPGINEMFSEGDEAEVDIVHGTVINLATGARIQGETLPEDSPPFQLVMAGGLVPMLEKEYGKR